MKAGLRNRRPLRAHGHERAWNEPPKPAIFLFTDLAQPSVDGSSIFVACNKSSEIVEVDAAE
jgi:hypothetical protein